jgi:hypothetical protein
MSQTEEQEEVTVLDSIQAITEDNRAFYNIIRFLDNSSRNNIVALHLRNTNGLINLLNRYLSTTPHVTSMVVNIPANSNFFDTVPVVPTSTQIAHATETNIPITDDTICSICQDPITSATRLVQCGHCFHAQCISEWFTMNPRCPMCRNDIRNANTGSTNERNRVHTNQE